MASHFTGLNSPKKILMVHLGGLGDLLLATPAFRFLRSTFPQARVTLLVCEGSAELVRCLPYFDQIVAIPSRSPEFYGLRFIWHKRPWEALPTLFSLRRERVDLAINFCAMTSTVGAFKMAAFFKVIGAKVKAGRDTEGRGFFLDIRSYEPFLGELHDVDYMVRLVEKVGAGQFKGKPSLELSPSEAAEKEAELFLTGQGMREKEPFLCVTPGGCWPSHRWRLENFEKALSLLMEKVPYNIVCLGSPREVRLGEKLRASLGKRLILGAGKLSLRGVVSVLKRSSLLFSNNTAMIHIASAVETPVVEVSGSSDSTRLHPYLPAERYILLQKPVGCSPCEKNRCWRRSLDQITPLEAASACLTLLRRLEKLP